MSQEREQEKTGKRIDKTIWCKLKTGDEIIGKVSLNAALNVPAQLTVRRSGRLEFHWPYRAMVAYGSGSDGLPFPMLSLFRLPIMSPLEVFGSDVVLVGEVSGELEKLYSQRLIEDRAGIQVIDGGLAKPDGGPRRPA